MAGAVFTKELEVGLFHRQLRREAIAGNMA